MTDISDYAFEELGDDGQVALFRGRRNGDPGTLLAMAPVSEQPTPDIVARLEHAYSIRDALDVSCVACPRELVHHQGRRKLLLDDPGGELLANLPRRPMKVSQFLRIAIGIAGALGRFHARGLIHNDVKPANILVDAIAGEAWLTGLCLSARPSRQRQDPQPPEVIAGTLPYMAPEQTGRVNRSVDSRSDLYAFGVTLYEILTGTLPFTATDPMEWVHCHIARLPLPPSERVKGIPEMISALIMKLLAKAPEERYQTAAGVESDLRNCLAAWEAHGRIEIFPLSARDTSDQFLIPEKLYGREAEIEMLLAAFARVVSQGMTELVLVSGYSGVGKSSVVNELHRALVPRRGLFASGKFDQYKRDIPYATLAQAFQTLVRQILAQSDAEVTRRRDALREALGSNGQLMVNLIPELELIIGEQPAVEELPAQEQQSRFKMAFRRFLGVFARPEHPLALFLDDLQWLDAATLDLLGHLITHDEVRHLLLIGAYRDNEVGPSHPLLRMLADINKTGAPVHRLALASLGLNDVARLVADTLHCPQEQAHALAQLVHEKTGGNPFFAIQFITALAEESLIAFSRSAAAWTWDMDRIRAKGFTDNVVELMVAKLSRLSATAQDALKQLACLGNTAQTATLVTVHGESGKALDTALGEAIRLGLVSLSNEAYSFVHDRVQEAAYSLLPEGERAAAHLRIGRILAARMEPAEIKERIFDLVDQFDRGAALITSQDEREYVAELNLAAGKRAKASTAYASARGYLSAGGALLTEETWERRYVLAFELKLEHAACELLSAHFAAAEQLIAELLKRAKTNVDRAAAYRLRIELHVLQSENKRAVESALECLRFFDIIMSPHPDRAELASGFEEVWRKLDGRSVESLVDLPRVTDPDVEAAMSVLSVLYAPAFFTDEILTGLHLCHTIDLTLEHGMSGASAHAFGLFGMMIGHFFGRYADGYRFGQLARALVKRHGFAAYEAKTLKAMEELSVWTHPISSAVDWIRAAFLAANESGDVTVACYSCNHTVTDLLMRGDHLDDVWQEADRCLTFVRRASFGDVAEVIVAQQRFVQNMRGRTASFSSFDGDEFDQSRFEERLTPQRNLTMVCWYWILKAKARFIFGEFEAAALALERARPLLWSSIGRIQYLDYHLFSALTLAALDPGPPLENQASERHRQLRTHCEQLARWTESCPATFADKHLLIAAEVARVEGREWDAARLYDEAIRAARENGFIPNEAIANEVAARFYAARGRETIFQAYSRNARSCYLRWGALGKVQWLDQQHPWLRAEFVPAPRTTTIGAPVGHFDVESVVRASQALSGEIVLGKLIETLMRITVEHAGAGRGLLIVLRNEDPRIEAEATTGRGSVEVTLRQAVVTHADLPESMLHYVIRTRENVVLDDASAGNLYADDEYVRQRRPRSVLCLPIVKQTKLVGALYLENSLTPRAFTSDRVAVLELLASQAAISLENARLYADLEQENLERKRAQEELGRSEGLLAEGQRISRTGSWTWNLKTGKLIWSAEQRRIFGFPPEAGELNYDDFAGKIHPEDRPLALQTMEDATRLRASFDHEFRIVLPDQSVTHLRGSGRPIVRASGEVEEYIGAVMDVTERKRTENELRRSEALFAQAQRLTRTSSLYWRVSTGEIIWSEESFRLMEYPRSVTPTVELIMKRCHPDDLALVQETVARSARHGTNMDLQHRLLMPNGSVKHVHVMVQNIGLDSEEFEFVGAVADITEQVQAKSALEDALGKIGKSEDQLRTIIDTIPALAWSAQADGAGEFFSQGWLNYTGLSIEEAKGEGWAAAIHPDDIGMLHERWMTIIASRKPGELEARMRRFDGEYRWFLIRGAPLIDQWGNVVKWYGTNTEIEDRKRAEEDLRRSKVYLEHAQRLSHTGSVGLRVSDGQIFWSKETARIYGYDPALPPTREMVLQRVHPDDVVLLTDVLSRAVQGGASFDFEHRLLMPDGSLKYVRNFAHSVKDEAGHEEVLGAVTDITEQYKAKAALEEALARIKESEDELRTIIDTIPALAWSSPENGVGDFFSKRWLDYTGLSKEEAQGTGWIVAIHPDDVGTLTHAWTQIRASGKEGGLEARLRRFDGEYRWFLFRAAPLIGHFGNDATWYGTNTDIDDLKRAETLLAGEKRLFEMVATGESLPVILDALCRVVEDLTDGSLASILLLDGDGKRLRHCAAPSLPASYIKAIDEGLIGPSAGTCGTAAYRGERVFVSDIAADPLWADYRELALKHGLRACFSTPILSSDGKVLGTFAIYSKQARQITPREDRITEQFTHLARIVVERKRAEDALTKSEATLVEGERISHTGSWTWSMGTDQILWSEECARLYGFGPEERAVTYGSLLERVHPEDRPLVEAKRAEAMSREGAFNFEQRIVLPDGSIRLLQNRGRPLLSESGDVREYIGTVLDITDQRNNEEEMRKAEEALRKVQAELAHVTRVTTLGELTASIAHEVNQPLTGIVMGGNASLRWLASDSPNLEEAREAIRRVLRDGKRAGEVIARIRKLFKNDEPIKEPLDINEVIQEVIVLTRNELQRNSIALKLYLGDNVPPVLGDRVQLQQVLMNLILNAIEAMNAIEDGSRKLGIRTADMDGDQVCVEVQDSGVGVDPKDADRIFETFHTTKPGGMGMGLAICRSIVENHGGRLQAAAHDGPGATLRFTLLKHGSNL